MYRSAHHWHLAHFGLAVAFTFCNAQAWLSAAGNADAGIAYDRQDLNLLEFERWALLASTAYFCLAFTGQLYAPSEATIWILGSIYETLVFPTAMIVVALHFNEVSAISAPHPAIAGKYSVFSNKAALLLAGHSFETLAVYHGNRDIMGDAFRTLFWAVGFIAILAVRYPEERTLSGTGIVLAYYFVASFAALLVKRGLTASVWDAPHVWFMASDPAAEAAAAAATPEATDEVDDAALFSGDEDSAGVATTQKSAKNPVKKAKRSRKPSMEEDQKLAYKLQMQEIPKELQINSPGPGMSYSPQKERLRRRPQSYKY